MANFKKIDSNQWILAFLIVFVGLASLLFHMLKQHSLHNSAALYVGLPTLLAVSLALMPKAQSVSGMFAKGMTIAILMSLPLFQEGFICVLMASPILYVIGFIVTGYIDRTRKQKDTNKIQSSLVIGLFVLLSMEGVFPETTFNRYNEVSQSVVINAPAIAILQKINQQPSFKDTTPSFISIFPKPNNISNWKLETGSTINVDFEYKKWVFWNSHYGTASFEVNKLSDMHFVFYPTQDTSYISNYLDWEKSELTIEPIGNHQTRVTWKLGYERKLDPIWYFGPLQYYAARLTAETLIQHVANPKY